MATPREAISNFVHQRIWIVLSITFVVLVSVLIIQPFAPAPVITADDVATAWNESIARLGISPLYPPGEDFYVGDLWGVVAQDETAANAKHPATSDEAGKSTLLGKSVRIAYIDLREQIKSANSGQPIFPETKDYKADQAFYHDTLQEVDKASPNSHIILSLAAFPGVTITHKTNANAALDWSIGGFHFGGENQESEQLRIPVAETYGAPVGAAFIRLDEWCADPKTGIFCTDAYVRRIMAYSISKGVLATTNRKYNTRLNLLFVYRVFMTREIQHNQTVSGGRTETLQISQKPSAEAGVGSQPANNQNGSVASNIAISNARQIGLHEIFQRPLVFGYRAVTIDLEPSEPAKAQP